MAERVSQDPYAQALVESGRAKYLALDTGTTDYEADLPDLGDELERVSAERDQVHDYWTEAVAEKDRIMRMLDDPDVELLNKLGCVAAFAVLSANTVDDDQPAAYVATRAILGAFAWEVRHG